MAKLKGELQADNGDILYPHTGSQVVFRPDGTTLEAGVQEIEQYYVDNRDKQTSIADIEIKGRTLVNLFGRAGNAIYQQFPSNPGNGVTVQFNGDIIKLTKNSYENNWILNWSAMPVISASKNYICIVEARVTGKTTGVNPTVAIAPSQAKPCSGVNSTNSSTFQPIYFLTKSTDVSSTSGITQFYIDISMVGTTTAGDIAELRNLRIYEVSDIESTAIGSMTAKQVAEKYPYVDDVKCIVNPYMESKENLLEGAILGWYSNSGGLITGDGTNKDWGHYGVGSWIPVEPSTTYTLYNPFKDRQALVLYKGSDGSQLSSEWRGWGESITFATSKESIGVQILFANLSTEEVKRFRSSVTFVKGSVPKKYEDCNNSRIMFETKLYQGETISRSNDGTYVKNSEWDEITFLGLKYFTTYNVPDNSTKIVIFTCPESEYLKYLCVSYDGRIMSCGNGLTIIGTDCNLDYSTNRLSITLSNNLTGWGDDYTPTQEEIKAFFLGWRMSTVGGSQYPGGVEKKFWTKLWCGVGTKVKESDGEYVIPGTATDVLPKVMNDQGYTPYRLLYKKATPTVEEVKTYGGLVVKEGIDVNVSSGLVLKEEVNADCIDPSANKYRFHRTSHPITRLNNKLYKSLSVEFKGKQCTFTNVLTSSPMEYVLLGTSFCDFYIDDPITKICTDYLIYRPDTVTVYDYSINTYDTVLDTLNKGNHELVATKEELAKTKLELARAKVELSQRSNPNLLINGDFQVWQRGESFSNTVGTQMYTADRWNCYRQSDRDVVLSVTRKDECLNVTAVSGTGIYYITQCIEVPSSLWGKKITLSYEGDQIYSNIAFNSNVSTAYLRADLGLVLSNSNHDTKKVTGIVPFGAKALTITLFENVATKSSFNLKWVKLEVGEYATPFVPRTYAEELAMCQRYFELVDNSLSPVFNFYPSWDGVLRAYQEQRTPFSVPKRVNPTFTLVPIRTDKVYPYQATANNIHKGAGHNLKLNLEVSGNAKAFEIKILDNSSKGPIYDLFLNGNVFPNECSGVVIHVDAEIY